jgi:hypothetical protein
MNYSSSSALDVARQATKKLNALQTEQLIGLSGHHPIQPQLHRIDVGLPRTKTSPALQQLATFTPQDN